MIDRLFVFQWKLGILRWNCQAAFHGLSGLADTIRFLIWAKIGPSLPRRVFLPVTVVLNTSTFFKRADASEATNCLQKLMPHAVRIRASGGRRWITLQHNSTCHCQFRIVAESICGFPSDTASRSGFVDKRSPTVRTPGSSSRSAVVLSIDRAFSSVLPISPQKLSCSHSKSGATAAGIVAFATVDSGNATDFKFAAAFFCLRWAWPNASHRRVRDPRVWRAESVPSRPRKRWSRSRTRPGRTISLL